MRASRNDDPLPLRVTLADQGIWPVTSSGAARQLYLCELELSPRALEARWRLLPTSEQGRAARYLASAARERFIAARSALRLVLASRLGLPPRAVPLRQTAAGKPILDGCSMHLSVSHSGARAVIACSSAGRVGVDIEVRRERPRWNEMLARISSGVEWREVLGHGLLVHDEFLRRWTVKEALAKADGRGLAIDFKAIVLARGCDRELRIVAFESDRQASAHWEIEQLEPAEHCVSAVWERPSAPEP